MKKRDDLVEESSRIDDPIHRISFGIDLILSINESHDVRHEVTTITFLQFRLLPVISSDSAAAVGVTAKTLEAES